MVIIKNDPRKEATYGWYPSGENMYKPRKALQGYDKEYLFRGSNERVRLPAYNAQPSSAKQHQNSRNLPWNRHHAEKSPFQLTVTGYKPPAMKNATSLPKPPQAQTMSRVSSRLASAEVAFPDQKSECLDGEALNYYFAKRDITQAMQPIPVPNRLELGLPVDERSRAACDDPYALSSPALKASVRERAKSAYDVREKTSLDHQHSVSRMARPMSSLTTTVTRNREAQRSRSPYEDAACSKQQWLPTCFESESADSVVVCENDTISLAAESVDRVRDVSECGSALRRSSPPPYEKQLTTYGWRVEIPGDPLKLKQITRRLQYTVSCLEPEVRPNPPGVHVMDNNTYFYNTIPKRPMTFVVHPEWQSELFVAKRIDLEKKEGKKFHTRNFAFVY